MVGDEYLERVYECLALHFWKIPPGWDQCVDLIRDTLVATYQSQHLIMVVHIFKYIFNQIIIARNLGFKLLVLSKQSLVLFLMFSCCEYRPWDLP